MALPVIEQNDLDLRDLIRAGDMVTWGQGLAEPTALVRQYIAQRQDIGPTRAFLGMVLSDTFGSEYTDFITPVSYGALGSVAAFAKAGTLEMVPSRYGLIPQLMASGKLRPDVVFVQLSPAGPDGTHALGWCNDMLPTAMQHARVVIAEINSNVPWVRMDAPIDESRITAAIHSTEPLPDWTSPAPGPTEAAIAHALADYIPEDATLQYGVGAVPSAILNALKGHRNLGLHSGLVTDEIVDLTECGALTNARKALLPGIGIGAVALGSDRLAHFMTNTASFRLCQTTFTHDGAVLAALDNLVAINSALEVDLFGQINAEQVGSRYLGAIGGQPEFMHAATAAPNGASIIAMPASYGKGRSRIVPEISGPFVTNGRYNADLVATEFGVADLRGLSVDQRARALISVAPPDHRDALTAAGRERGLGV